MTDAKTLEGISKYTTTVVLRAIVNNISYTKFDQNPFFFNILIENQSATKASNSAEICQ